MKKLLFIFLLAIFLCGSAFASVWDLVVADAGGNGSNGTSASTVGNTYVLENPFQYDSSVTQIKLIFTQDPLLVSIKVGSAYHDTVSYGNIYSDNNAVTLTIPSGVSNTVLTYNSPGDFTAFNVKFGHFPIVYSVSATGTLRRTTSLGAYRAYYYASSDKTGVTTLTSYTVLSGLSNDLAVEMIGPATNVWSTPDATAIISKNNILYVNGALGQYHPLPGYCVKNGDWAMDDNYYYLYLTTTPTGVTQSLISLPPAIAGITEVDSGVAICRSVINPNGTSGTTLIRYREVASGVSYYAEYSTSSNSGDTWGAWSGNLIPIGASGVTDIYGHVDLVTVYFNTNDLGMYWTGLKTSATSLAMIGYSSSTGGLTFSGATTVMDRADQPALDQAATQIHHSKMYLSGTTAYMFYVGVDTPGVERPCLATLSNYMTNRTTVVKWPETALIGENAILPLGKVRSGVTDPDYSFIRTCQPFAHSVSGVTVIYWPYEGYDGTSPSICMGVSLEGDMGIMKKGVYLSKASWYSSGIQDFFELDYGTNPLTVFFTSATGFNMGKGTITFPAASTTGAFKALLGVGK